MREPDWATPSEFVLRKLPRSLRAACSSTHVMVRIFICQPHGWKRQRCTFLTSLLSCRLKLRVPDLTDQSSWLPALCICVHAAEGVLSTYFQLYLPILEALAKHSNETEADADRPSTLASGKLPPTWRQVRRIMMSAFVIVYAYWHGEMIHGEASRYMAMVRLLLEYPRWRWGEKLHEALEAVAGISRLSGFNLFEDMKTLLPGVSRRFPSPSNSTRQDGTEMGAHARDAIADSVLPYEDNFAMSGAWPSISDDSANDSLTGYHINTIEDQTLLGLWETIESTAEGARYVNNWG